MKIEGDNYSRRAEIYWNSKYLRKLIDEGHKRVYDFNEYMEYVNYTGTDTTGTNYLTFTTGSNTWCNVA